MMNNYCYKEQREGFVFFIVLCLIFCLSQASAREDTLQKKSTVSVDTVRAVLYKPIRFHGLMQSKTDNNALITKNDIRPTAQFGLFDVLMDNRTVTSLSLGGISLNNSVSVFGSGRRDLSLRYNGRALDDKVFGGFNLEQFPVETAESIEIYTGTEAIVLGDNSSGLLINVQEMIHDTKTPYTRLRYGQTAYNLVASEGEFSQNFAPNWNFTFGFRRHVSDGRFLNSWVDMWNVRGALRWNPAPNIHLSLSNIFTNYGAGTNGGLNDTTPSVSNTITATVNYSDLNERVFRHDITLSGSMTNSDTSIIQNANLYFSHSLWNRDRNGTLFLGGSDTVRTSSFIERTVGLTYKSEFAPSTVLSTIIGGEGELQFIEKSAYHKEFSGTNLSGYFLGNVKLSDFIRLTPGIRLRLLDGKFLSSVGGKLTLQPIKELRFGGDFSVSSRAPAIIEGKELNSEKNVLLIGFAEWSKTDFNCKADFFIRNTSDIIIATPINNGKTIISTSFSNSGDRTAVGGSLGFSYVFDRFTILGNTIIQQSTTNGKSDGRFPTVKGTVGLQYERQFGRSTVKGGISTTLFSSNYGERFIPQTQSSIIIDNTNNDFAYDGVTAFIGAKLGNAFVQFSMRNILDATYWNTSVYPNLDRHLRISVNWAFFD